MTGWYLAVIFASLALYSVGMYFGLRKAIEDTVDNQLQVRSENIAQFLKTNAVQQTADTPKLLPRLVDLTQAMNFINLQLCTI